MHADKNLYRADGDHVRMEWQQRALEAFPLPKGQRVAGEHLDDRALDRLSSMQRATFDGVVRRLPLRVVCKPR